MALELEAEIVRDAHKGGWTYVLLPGSKDALGTGKAVKVVGTVDETPVEATLMPFGGGTHMLPLKQAVIRALGKTAGERVGVRVELAASPGSEAVAKERR